MHKIQPPPGATMPATFPPTYVDAQGVTLSAYLDTLAGAYRRACDVGLPESLDAAAEAMRAEIRSRLNGSAPSLRACVALIVGK